MCDTPIAACWATEIISEVIPPGCSWNMHWATLKASGDRLSPTHSDADALVFQSFSARNRHIHSCCRFPWVSASMVRTLSPLKLYLLATFGLVPYSAEFLKTTLFIRSLSTFFAISSNQCSPASMVSGPGCHLSTTTLVCLVDMNVHSGTSLPATPAMTSRRWESLDEQLWSKPRPTPMILQ